MRPAHRRRERGLSGGDIQRPGLAPENHNHPRRGDHLRPATAGVNDVHRLLSGGRDIQTTYIVADGQQGGLSGLNNRTLVDGTETANHTLNGAGPGSEYWDALTQDITTSIPPSDTAVTIQVESAADLGVGDCITWVSQVLSVPPLVPVNL